MGGMSADDAATRDTRSLSLYREIDRAEWARLAAGIAQPLTETEIVQLRGLGDRLDMAEVARGLPAAVAAAVAVRRGDEAARRRHGGLPGRADTTTPFVVGVAGSVAVGKSTIARLLRELMSRWPGTPRVELVTTDGFLYPNAELERRGLMDRKGFPESYDRRALVVVPHARSRAAPPRCARRSTRTCATTSCPTRT